MMKKGLFFKNLIFYNQQRNVRQLTAKETEICWKPMCGLEIRKVPLINTEKCKIASFLGKHYFPDEPLLKTGGLGKGKADPGILQYFTQALNDDKALYARVQESREILGVAIGRITTRTTVHELRILADRMATDKARRYVHLLAQIEDRANFYNMFQTDKMFSLDVLAVNKVFRRRGIGQILIEAMKRMAVNTPQTDYMRFATANYYGSLAAEKCGGLKRYQDKTLSTYKDARGVPWIKKEMCSPHRRVEIFTSNLKAEIPPPEKEEAFCEKYGLSKLGW